MGLILEDLVEPFPDSVLSAEGFESFQPRLTGFEVRLILDVGLGLRAAFDRAVLCVLVVTFEGVDSLIRLDSTFWPALGVTD